MNIRPLCTLALLASLVWPLASHAEPLGARQAMGALDRGAQAWDVRDMASNPERLLPGATRAALDAWDRSGTVDDLARAVSAAGIDLSRDVVVYGAAGDARAQALVAALTTVATGRVHWLVGGIDEWQAAGLPTVASATVRRPVPQYLVARPAGPVATPGAPAAAPLRGSADAPPGTALAARG